MRRLSASGFDLCPRIRYGVVMIFVASALCTDGDARADLRLTQIANPLKRAFHSKPDVELSITLGHLLALV